MNLDQFIEHLTNEQTARIHAEAWGGKALLDAAKAAHSAADRARIGGQAVALRRRALQAMDDADIPVAHRDSVAHAIDYGALGIVAREHITDAQHTVLTSALVAGGYQP